MSHLASSLPRAVVRRPCLEERLPTYGWEDPAWTCAQPLCIIRIEAFTIAELHDSLKGCRINRTRREIAETANRQRGYYLGEANVTYFIRSAYSMSRRTACSSGVKLPFVFSSKTDSRSIISLA